MLHLTLATDRGGAEAVIETVASRLDASRYECLLAAPRHSPLAQAWIAAGYTVVELPPIPRLRDASAGRALVEALTAELVSRDVALVHTHGVGAQLYGGWAASRAGCAVVWHLHDFVRYGWSVESLVAQAAATRRHDAVIAISQAVAESATTLVPRHRMALIPNGVSAERVTPVPRETGGPLVVWCGRLQRWKGPDLFLAAAAVTLQQHPTARFAVVGGTLFGMEPDLPDALRALATTLGVEPAVEWVGQVADARPWMAAATVVVHSSASPEPFGLVVPEAMMQSRPVVAFNHGGPAEVIQEGRTGTLVRPGDTAALGRAVSMVLAEPPLARAWGQAGRDRAVRCYESGGMVRRIESAYDRIGVRNPAA